MGIIVAAHPNLGDPEEWEFPVLTVGASVDSGYVLESVGYYLNIEGASKSRPCSEYSPHDKNCKQFRIGLCWFVEKDGNWFFAEAGQEPSEKLYPIVYGQKTLEAYRSGDMFKRLNQLFGGPD